MWHSKALGSYVSGVGTHMCKSTKNAIELYEQALSVKAYLLQCSRRHQENGGTICIEVKLIHEVAGTPTICGQTRFVEVGGFESPPEVLDVGDRLSRNSKVGLGFECLKKVLTHLGQSETAPDYRSSVLTYWLRESLGGRKEGQDVTQFHDGHKTIFVGCLSAVDAGCLSVLKSLDKVNSYVERLTERVEKFRQQQTMKESRGQVSKLRSQARVTMRQSRGSKEEAKTSASAVNDMLSSGFFVARNHAREIELEVEEIITKERERIVNEKEAAEKEKREKEEELVRLGVKKPKKKVPSFLAKFEDKKVEEAKSQAEGGEDDLHTFDYDIQRKIESLNKIKDDIEISLKTKVIATKDAADARLHWFSTKRTVALGPEKAVEHPYLVPLSADAFMNGKVRHFISPGKFTIGRRDALTVINMPLGGSGVDSNHCEITNNNGMLYLKTENDVYVNGIAEIDIELHHGDTVCIGSAHVFKVWNRNEIEEKRESGDSILIKQIEKQLVLPTLNSELEMMIDQNVMDLQKQSRRHWQKFNAVKQQLGDEAARCELVLNAVKEGRTKKGDVDVASVESCRGDCETAILDMDDWKRVHDKVMYEKVLEMYHVMAEVNEIGEELEKFMVFEVGLVAVGGPKNDVDKGIGDDFDVGGLEGEEKKEDVSSMLQGKPSLTSGLMDVASLNIKQYKAFPAEFWVKVKYTTGENPEELWHMHKFYNRLEGMREMFSTYLDCGKDLMNLSRRIPALIDPFYEPPNDSLIGVAYCFMDALSYMIEIHESVTVINFKGKLVGEIEMEVFVQMEDNGRVYKEKAGEDDEVDFTSQEFVIADHLGQTMLVSINVKTAKGIPRRCCNGVFVSFPFFLQQVPFCTTRCQKQTVNPWFNETFSVKQVITEDFIDYLSHNALEIELWGAPDSKIDPEEEERSKQVVLVGECIEIDVKEIEDEEEDEEELDIAFLNEQLDDTRHELKVQRDVVKQAKAEREKADKEKERLEKAKAEEKSEFEGKIKELEEKARKDKEAIEKLKAGSGICLVM
ncbi:hypothetical protein TL16_g06796 [Triparma laevis f. inornata]|uniref:C2 domain-containing protein n=1 Tax=Triparma laevis f. inornata TaxID=1714386 RepID=A0A9W7EE88_9STRA|nr:hypothetical protein TL16_g06796 [Triparma laevis f. inornata]